MRYLRQRVFRFEMERLEPPLERPADLVAQPVETHCPRALQPLHPIAQIRLRGLHRQMKMVAHYHKRMEPPAKPLRRFEQTVLKRLRRALARKQVAAGSSRD